MPALRVVEANLAAPEHQAAVLALTAAYAADEMGNGAPLSADVQSRLIDGLRAHPTTVIFLAYLDERPVGIATCFTGFSTFAARPVINIHDLAVSERYRGRGIGRALLSAVETHARSAGYARVTLEVGDRNVRARRVYEAAGFRQADYGTHAGSGLFYVKRLDAGSSA